LVCPSPYNILVFGTVMKRYCEMTMEFWDFRANFYPCGRPAKYITPKDPMKGRKIYVCGIHKNSINAFHKRTGSSKRCKGT